MGMVGRPPRTFLKSAAGLNVQRWTILSYDSSEADGGSWGAF